MLTLGVSLKAYFGYAQTVRWATRVREVAADAPPGVELFVIPSFPVIPALVAMFSGTRVVVGAQNIAHDESGALTGETSGAMLRELGCGIAEIGHAERRSLFAETDELIALKVATAYRHGLTPLLCVGESELGTPERAARFAIEQIERALVATTARGRMLVAYEPGWAIGAPKPADPEHVMAVSSTIRESLASAGMSDSAVLYGGSAGPGLLSTLGGSVDGLFLGRFAHDPVAIEAILREAATVNGGSETRKTPDSARHEAGDDGDACSVPEHEEEGL